MRKLTKVFLIISVVQSIISTIYTGIFAILFMSGSFTSLIINISKATDPETTSIISGVCLACGILLFIVSIICFMGILFSRKALSVLGTKEMRISDGVFVIIFGWLPAGILYLVYRYQYMNSFAHVV